MQCQCNPFQGRGEHCSRTAEPGAEERPCVKCCIWLWAVAFVGRTGKKKQSMLKVSASRASRTTRRLETLFCERGQTSFPHKLQNGTGAKKRNWDWRTVTIRSIHEYKIVGRTINCRFKNIGCRFKRKFPLFELWDSGWAFQDEQLRKPDECLSV